MLNLLPISGSPGDNDAKAKVDLPTCLIGRVTHTYDRVQMLLNSFSVEAPSCMVDAIDAAV